MFSRNALFMTLCAFTLVFAGGRTAPEDNGNGVPWNDDNGIDTTEVEGTVTMVDEDEQMLIVEHAFGEDTIYWDDQTVIPEGQEDMVLTEGTEVIVEYVEESDRNLATRIELGEDNGMWGDEENGEREKDNDYNGEYENSDENNRR